MFCRDQMLDFGRIVACCPRRGQWASLHSSSWLYQVACCIPPSPDAWSFADSGIVLSARSADTHPCRMDCSSSIYIFKLFSCTLPLFVTDAMESVASLLAHTSYSAPMYLISFHPHYCCYVTKLQIFAVHLWFGGNVRHCRGFSFAFSPRAPYLSSYYLATWL